MVSTRSVLGIIVMMGFVASSGCSSESTFAIERRRPPTIALPPVATVAVAAFVGSAGHSQRAAVRRALAEGQAFSFADERLDETSLAKAALAEDDAAIARLATAAGVSAVVTGKVIFLEVSRTLEAPTLVTKRVDGQPKDVPTVRQLKTGRLSVQFRVVLADGRVIRGRPCEKDVRAERTEDPLPHLTTLEPKDFPRDPIPTDDEMARRLFDDAAAEFARDVTPRREPVVVTWEDAGDANEPARGYFAKHDYARAAQALSEALGEPADPFVDFEGPADAKGPRPRDGRPRPELSVRETAAALYDLGLCEDALGNLRHAGKLLDRALTLECSERHLAVLRDLRRREDALAQEARR